MTLNQKKQTHDKVTTGFITQIIAGTSLISRINVIKLQFKISIYPFVITLSLVKDWNEKPPLKGNAFDEYVYINRMRKQQLFWFGSNTFQSLSLATAEI